MATIGVSTERGIVRGVLLGTEPSADGAVHELTEAKEQVVDDSGDTASAVVSMLDAVDEGSAADVRGAAVAYRDAEERHAIVSALASSRWSASSLVSAKAAQLASLAEIPGLGEYRNLLMYEAAPGLVTMSVVDATRTKVLATDSVTSSSHTAETIGSSVGRGWELLDSSDVVPDAVVLFGSRADDPDVVPVLETGFSVPVIKASAPASTTAFGAALLAARDIPGSGFAAPGAVAAAAAGRSRRPYVLAAAAAVLLGAGGLGVAGILSNSDSADTTTSAGPATSAGSPAQMGATGSASPSVQSPSAQSPAAPVPPPAPAAAPPQTQDAQPVDDAPAVTAWTQDPTTQAWVPAPTTAWKEPSTASPPPPAQAAAPAPAAPPAPTTVGNPNGSWLFPGESPPPPPGDPSANAWWANHFELKDRWLHHE